MNHEERALSALIKNSDMVSIMGDQLGTLLESHKDIWDFIDHYYRSNKAVPPAEVVLETFPEFEYDDEIKGATKHYVERLKAIKQQTEIQVLMAKVGEGIKKGVSPEVLLQKISKKVVQVQRATGVARSIDVRDTEDALDHFDRVKQLVAQHDGRPGIAFGYEFMDEHYPTGAAPGHLIVGLGYSGLGKQNDLDSIVYDKNGPKRFGDLKVGDYVIGRNGCETMVTGTFPQEDRRAYKVTLNDGTFSIAGPDHLWNIQTHKLRQTKYDQVYKTVTTQELLEKYLPKEHGEVNKNGDRSKIYRAFLPLCEPVDFEKKDVPVDPYLLGVLLSNGTYQNDSLTFTTNDEYIAQKVIDRNPQVKITECTPNNATARRWRIHSPKAFAETIGWTQETKSPNKSIPEEYLHGSIEQRKDLLSGILDCDSHFSARNNNVARPRYGTTSRKMMDQVTSLIRGLGGTAEEKTSDNRAENEVFYSLIWLPFNPYTLDRMAESYNPSYKPMRAIESIEQVEDREMMCISVDAPDQLYLVDDFIVTHNTWFCISLMINAWKQGYSPLIINLEMSPEDLRDRIYLLISHYSMNDLVRANIDTEDFKAWAKDFMKGKAEFHLVGNDTFDDFSVDMVHAKVEQYRPDILLLDYASLFTDREHSQQETVRMKNLSRQLKQLATAMKIPIILISAVTGKDKKDRVNPPDIAQVAWSSGIEYDANLAFAIHTHRNPMNQKAEKTEIVCRKNRHGELFSFFVKMDLNAGTITEVPVEDQIDYLDSDQSYLDDPEGEEKQIPDLID